MSALNDFLAGGFTPELRLGTPVTVPIRPKTVADWGAAEADESAAIFNVPGVGVFARHGAAGGILVPLEIHPDYSDWTLVTSLHADTVDLEEPPSGWFVDRVGNGDVSVVGDPKVIRVQSGPNDVDSAANLLFTTPLENKRHFAAMKFGFTRQNTTLVAEVELLTDDDAGVHVRIQPVGGGGDNLWVQNDDVSLTESFSVSPFLDDPTSRTSFLAFQPRSDYGAIVLRVMDQELSRLIEIAVDSPSVHLATGGADRFGFLCDQSTEVGNFYARFDIRYIAIYRAP